MGVGILVASHIFGQRSVGSKIKDSPYECGLASEVKGETRYSVKFYITAMLFILFDIDVVFLIPWVLTHRDLVAAGIPIQGIGQQVSPKYTGGKKSYYSGHQSIVNVKQFPTTSQGNRSNSINRVK